VGEEAGRLCRVVMPLAGGADAAERAKVISALTGHARVRTLRARSDARLTKFVLTPRLAAVQTLRKMFQAIDVI
jgi:hypothetical protein